MALFKHGLFDIPSQAGYSPPTAPPLPLTQMALARMGELWGIPPTEFAGVYTAKLFQHTRQCSDVWMRHNWMGYAQTSHEDVLLKIADAERDLETFMGWPLTPRFFRSKELEYPQFQGMYKWDGIRPDGRRAGVVLDHKFVHCGGVRKMTEVALGASVVYSNSQATAVTGDNPDNTDTDFGDLATITVPHGLATQEEIDAIDWRFIKVYVPGTLGNPLWELRPVIRIVIDSTNYVITMHSWWLTDPDSMYQLQTSQASRGLDVTSNANLLTEVDVYYEEVDDTVASVEFIWDQVPPSFSFTGCPPNVTPPSNGTDLGVGGIRQTGTFTVRDNCLGHIVPFPATYDDTTGEWTATAWATGYAPDRVIVNYYAGYVGDEFGRGLSHNPMDRWIEQTIHMLVSARMEELCGCDVVLAHIEELRKDFAAQSNIGNFLAISDEVQNNPFGIRRGEVLAYRRAVSHPHYYPSVGILR